MVLQYLRRSRKNSGRPQSCEPTFKATLADIVLLNTILLNAVLLNAAKEMMSIWNSDWSAKIILNVTMQSGSGEFCISCFYGNSKEATLYQFLFLLNQFLLKRITQRPYPKVRACAQLWQI